MPSIVLNCPNCRQPYQMSPEQIAKYSGRTITCRKCKQPFAFDTAMDAAAPAAGQTAPEEEEPVGTAAGAGAESEAAGEEESGYAAAASYAAPVATAPPPPPPRRAAPAAKSVQVPVPPVQPPAPPPQPAYAPQASAPPAVPVSPSPAAPVGDGVGGIADFFGFQRMALPALLPVVFWTGVAYCLYNGIHLLLSLLFVSGYHNTGSSKHGVQTLTTRLTFDGLSDRLISIPGFFIVIDALFWFILGPIFWRGFCELVMAASRLLASQRK